MGKNIDKIGTFKIEDHPISNVEWVDMDTLRANNYNPNMVARNEMKLLRISMAEDGWTQPIVARRDGEIVDGFHRWTIAKNDKVIREATGGRVPVVFLSADVSEDQQVMSTIRHNRARGLHTVLKMGDIVRFLIDDQGLSTEEVMRRLGMEWEEVERLYDRSGMTNRGAISEFRSGWTPIAGEGNVREDVDPTVGENPLASSISKSQRKKVALGKDK